MYSSNFKCCQCALRFAINVLGIGVLNSVAIGQTVVLHADGVSGATTPTTPNPGQSWNNAYKYLQDAIDRANALLVGGSPPAIVQIWVRGEDDTVGTIYYPDEGASVSNGVRSETFTLRASVFIYAGFEGDETALNQRDPFKYLTILDGDIDQDSQLDSDNSLHVVSALSSAITTSNCILDGFIVRNGRADDTSGGESQGGGILIETAAPKIYRCTITNNFAIVGGGIGCFDASGTTEIRNCMIDHNTAGNTSFSGGGGGVYADSDVVVINSTFLENSATPYGGGLNAPFASSGTVDVTLVNCRFISNHALSSVGAGGGVFINRGGTLTLTNCLVASNTAKYQSAGIFNGVAALVVTNCTIANNCASSGACGSSANGEGGGIGFYSLSATEPQITNTVFWGNQADTDIDLFYAAAAVEINVTNCIAEQDSFNLNVFVLTNVDDDDPLFGDAGNGNFRIESGSPCINAGDSNAIPDDEFDVDELSATPTTQDTPDLDVLPRVVGCQCGHRLLRTSLNG